MTCRRDIPGARGDACDAVGLRPLQLWRLLLRAGEQQAGELFEFLCTCQLVVRQTAPTAAQDSQQATIKNFFL